MISRKSVAVGLLASFFMAAVALGAPASAADRPLKVYILAGQSNMEGQAKVELLDYQVKQPATRGLFEHLQKDGKWIERDDVYIKFLERSGKLTVGYGSPGCIGPELEFGNVVGDHFGGPILLIKTAWGGRSLYRDFRPPTAGFPPDDVLNKTLEREKKKKPAATIEDIKKPFGASYRAMLEDVNGTLADIKKFYPGYDGQGYELAGFVWFQGWNDMIDATATAEYTSNLGDFIEDVRKDLKSPQLPVVVGQMGVDGVAAKEGNVTKFKAAQAAIVDQPQFKGNVALVKTDIFWDTEADAVFKSGWREHAEEWKKVGSNYPYHYLGSVKTMCAVGKAFGEAMITLSAKNAK